jgi:hypothetical protein
LLQTDQFFSVGSTALKVIILWRMYGDSYQLHMVTRLERWSKREIWTKIRFLKAGNVSAAESHRQLVAVDGNYVMDRESLW